MSNSKKISLRGSELAPLQGARAIGPTDPHQLIEISVVLKHRQSLPTPGDQGNLMTHTDFATRYGADPAQVGKIVQFGRDHNRKAHLSVTNEQQPPSTVGIRGLDIQMQAGDPPQ